MYIRLCTAALGLTLTLALVSCGDSPEKATEETISLMNALGDTLGTIKDKASAEAAADKLKSLITDMKALKERMNKLPKPSAEADSKLKEKYKANMEAAQAKMTAAMMKIASAGPEAQEVLKGVMEGFKDIAK